MDSASQSLERFVEAQQAAYATACRELEAGRKQSHWMWFISPQLRGLGSSAMAQRYGIASAAEAEAYWQHPLLGSRLKACTGLVLANRGRSARSVFGAPDDLRFCSCMTLFAQVAPDEPVFGQALLQFFGGRPDARTLALLTAAGANPTRPAVVTDLNRPTSDRPAPARATRPNRSIPSRSDGRVDWFERLTGFTECGYAQTRGRLEVDGSQLRSRVNGQCYGIGQLELVSLEALRLRASGGQRLARQPRVRVVQGDVRPMHRDPAHAGALFQVASQFNLLEMVGPGVTPEQGVTRYIDDRTQGPACAIAAGAATLYRNYFVPVAGQHGQTAAHQLDGFEALGTALAQAVGRPPASLWTMRNGYAMFTRDSIDLLAQHLTTVGTAGLDALRGLLRIGVHWDVEVTDADARPRPQVSQAFCSALPVSYNASLGTLGARWQPLALLVLEAAYEATLWSAVLNAQRGASNTVLLTSLGGGAFGNDEAWIEAALRRAIATVAGQGLDIVLVSYDPPTDRLLQLARDFA